jgi:hypothetical protein
MSCRATQCVSLQRIGQRPRAPPAEMRRATAEKPPSTHGLLRPLPSNHIYSNPYGRLIVCLTDEYFNSLRLNLAVKT